MKRFLNFRRRRSQRRFSTFKAPREHRDIDESDPSRSFSIMNPAVFDRPSESSTSERPYVDPFTTRCLRQSCSLLVESVNSRQYQNKYVNNNVSTSVEPPRQTQRHYRATSSVSTTYPKDTSTTAVENASTIPADRLAPLSEEPNAYREERNDSGVAMNAQGQKSTNDPSSTSGALATDENMHWDAFSVKESKNTSKPLDNNTEAPLSTIVDPNPVINTSTPPQPTYQNTTTTNLPLSRHQSQDIPPRNTTFYSSAQHASSFSHNRISRQPLNHHQQTSSWSSRSHSPGHNMPSSTATKRPTFVSMTKRWAAHFSRKMHLKSS